MSDNHNNNEIKNQRLDNNYRADSIRREQGAVKHRRAVSRFLGAEDMVGIENQLFEIIDNSIDESVAYSQKLRAHGIQRKLIIGLEIKDDYSVIVEDQGRGIPCEVHPEYNEPAIYLACEEDSAGGKSRGTDGYSNVITSGTHGAGMAVSKSCTEFFKLWVKSQSANGEFYLEYLKGERNGELQRTGDLNVLDKETGMLDSGTRIHYKFDKELFKISMGGRTQQVPYVKARISERLKYIMMKNENDIEIHFKFVNDPVEVITTVSITPEMVLRDTNILEMIIENVNIDEKFRAHIFLSFEGKQRVDFIAKTIVNRIPMLSAQINEAARDTFLEIMEGMFEEAVVTGAIQPNIRFDRKVYRKKLGFLMILEQPKAKYSGQTKQIHVNTDYLPTFERELYNKLSSSAIKPYLQKMFQEGLEDLLLEARLEEMKKKEQEKRKKAQEAERKRRQVDEEIERLSNDELGRAKEKTKANISIQDSPFPPEQSSIIYVEGDSAGSELALIHSDGPVPIATAQLRGKIPNIMDPENEVNKITIDNRLLVLNAGYKDIGILTDGDPDGGHIRVLLLHHIWVYKPEYLMQGRVYIIPAAHSEVNLPKDVTLNINGLDKKYQAGKVTTYSAIEHKTLVKFGGATSIRKFRGLADSNVSMTERIKNKSTWIQVPPPTQEDIDTIVATLEQESKFKQDFTAGVFTDRQFYSRKISNLKKDIKLSTKEAVDMLSLKNISTTPEILNHQAFMNITGKKR